MFMKLHQHKLKYFSCSMELIDFLTYLLLPFLSSKLVLAFSAMFYVERIPFIQTVSLKLRNDPLWLTTLHIFVCLTITKMASPWSAMFRTSSHYFFSALNGVRGSGSIFDMLTKHGSWVGPQWKSKAGKCWKFGLPPQYYKVNCQ